MQQHMQQMDSLMNGMLNDDMFGGPFMHPMLNDATQRGNGACERSYSVLSPLQIRVVK